MLVLLPLLGAACTPGPYPLDFFSEMHTGPAPRRLEPNRASAPSDSVPVSGRPPALTFAQAHALQNPVPTSATTLAHAQDVARVNCAMCHGADGHGDGPLAQQFSASEANPPVSFASPRVTGRTDGDLYWIIGHGMGNMPAFERLLSDQDIWTVVQFVRAAGNGG